MEQRHPKATEAPFRLRGGRVHLRDWRLADLEPYAEWMQPHHRWRQLDGPYYPRVTGERITRRLDTMRQRIARGFTHPRTRMVISETDVKTGAESDALIGTVSRYWQSEETRWLSVGISIYDPANWGRGLGFEALGLWCQYLLDQPLDLARVDLRTWSGNHGMIRLAEKLGFTREAVFRRARIVEGEFYDGLGFGVLREEWAARFPGGFASHLQQD